MATPEWSVERTVPLERLKNDTSASRARRGGAKKRQREPFSQRRWPAAANSFGDSEVVVFRLSLALFSCHKHECKAAPPPPTRCEFLEDKPERNKTELERKGATTGERVDFFPSQPSFDGVRQKRGKQKKRKTKNRVAKSLPSPALLARRVETVAVLVMRCWSC